VSAWVDRPAIAPGDVDRAGERVLGAIDSACAPDAQFSAQVGAGLRAALLALSEPPRVAGALVAYSDREEVRERQQHWRQAFATRLRDTAASHPELTPLPDFVEPYLIDALRWWVRRSIESGGEELLTAAAPDLLHYLLTYYLGGPEAAAAAQAAAMTAR
jgi:hypothetical protein